MTRALLPDALRSELVRRADAARPAESCGIVLGRRAGDAFHVAELVPACNLHPTPRSGFELDPAAIVAAEGRARRAGLALVGFYHSHPDRPAIPSHADRAGAWEGLLALIAGVEGGRTDVRAYRLLRGAFVEIASTAPTHSFPPQVPGAAGPKEGLRAPPGMEPATAQPKHAIFVGRQPIYGRRLELYAYELLYRGADVDYADFSEGDRATSQVLLNTFTEFGLQRIVGGHLAFINLTRGFIVGEYPLPVPRTQVVLEVLEDVDPDPQVLEGLQDLRRRGFKIALDDYDCRPEREPLLALADVVKLDILGATPDVVRQRYQQLKPYGMKLLAEKIETREQFELCRDVGFDYFQGYFLAKPNVVSGSSIPANNLNLLRLLAEFQAPEHDIERIAEIVSQDVALSYKLLRHINAAIYGMPRRIDSVRETVNYLGLTAVKNLACLFMLSETGEQPHELLVTAMMRARMCELLARAAKVGNVQSFFTVGLFSTLDALVNASMDHVVKKLPLAEDLQEALLDGKGPMGEALRCTLAYERGDWDAVDCLGLPRAAIKEAFLQSVAWVETVDQEIAAVGA